MNSLFPNIIHTRADSDLQVVLPKYTHGSLEGLRSFSFHSLWLQCPLTPFPYQKKRGVHKCLHQDGCPGEKRAHLSPVPHHSNGLMDQGGNTRSCFPAAAWPVWASCGQSSSKGCPHWGDPSLFCPQTLQHSSVLHSNFKIRVYEIPVWAPPEGRVDCSFEESFYSIRKWITLKLITYNEQVWQFPFSNAQVQLGSNTLSDIKWLKLMVHNIYHC